MKTSEAVGKLGFLFEDEDLRQRCFQLAIEVRELEEIRDVAEIEWSTNRGDFFKGLWFLLRSMREFERGQDVSVGHNLPEDDIN